MKKLEKITIELTNVCNLSCPGCPSGIGFFNNRPRGFMSFDSFKKIIDENKEIKHINLIGQGEPFLVPDIFKIIRYADEKGLVISIHTNGNKISEEVFYVLKKINTKISITFSIDGIRQESYEVYRRNGRLNLVLANLCKLVKLKKDNKLNNIKIIWQFLLMKHNKAEVFRLKKIVKTLGVDILKIKKPVFTDEMPEDKYGAVIKNENLGDNNDDFNVIRGGSCEFVDPGSLVVLWDGVVVPCCVDYKREVVLGSVLKSRLSDIWNNDKARKFRGAYKKNKNNLCFTCRFRKNKSNEIKKNKDKKLLVPKKNNTQCLFPHNAAYITPGGNIQVCCNIGARRGDLVVKAAKINNLKDLKNNKIFNYFNENLNFNNIKIDECENCWKRERMGVDSMRLTKDIDFLESQDLTFLKIDFSNECNLACVMCSPMRSTGWYSLTRKENFQKESIKNKSFQYFYLRDPKRDDVFLKINYLDIFKKIKNVSTLGHIEISGGEPMCSNDFLNFLFFCVENGFVGVELKIITNATMVNEEILSLLSNFKKISYLVSVDAVGDHYEYCRWSPAKIKHKLVSDNIIRLLNLKNTEKVCIANVLHAFNLNNSIDLYNWLKGMPPKVLIGTLFHDMVLNPSHATVFCLPLNLRKKYFNEIQKSNIDKKSKMWIMNNLDLKNDYPEKTKLFLEYSDLLDRSRGTNIVSVIPELKKYI